MATLGRKSMPVRCNISALATALFLLTALCFLYSFLFTAPFIPLEGFSWDSLLYLTPGQRMYQGDLIYRDVFEFVTPGTALVNLCMFKIFGLRLWIPNLLAMLLGLGIVSVGISISRKLMSPYRALLPSALFLVTSRGFICDSTHHWYSVLAALAAIAVLLEERTPWRIAAAGAFCGLSACFTQTRGLAVFVGFAVFLWWEARQKQEQSNPLLKNEALLFATFAGAFLAVNAYFIWEAGPVRYFWCTVVFVLKYYPQTSASNTLQVIETQFPTYKSLGTFLYPFVKWILSFGLIPLASVLFLLRYLRRSAEHTAIQWARPMLVAIVGLFMVLSIAPAPDLLRLKASALPALILLVWLFDSPHKLAKSSARVLTVAVACTSLYSLARQRPHPVEILATAQGQLAYTEPAAYETDAWILQHTSPMEYFYNAAYTEEYFYLNLHNPTPLPCIESDGYTTREQVSDIILGLDRHRARYILWEPAFLNIAPGSKAAPDDHLGPLREYLHSHYRKIKVFSNFKEIWERNAG
jgi:hypothetical protein